MSSTFTGVSFRFLGTEVLTSGDICRTHKRKLVRTTTHTHTNFACLTLRRSKHHHYATVTDARCDKQLASSLIPADTCQSLGTTYLEKRSHIPTQTNTHCSLPGPTVSHHNWSCVKSILMQNTLLTCELTLADQHISYTSTLRVWRVEEGRGSWLHHQTSRYSKLNTRPVLVTPRFKVWAAESKKWLWIWGCFHQFEMCVKYNRRDISVP